MSKWNSKSKKIKEAILVDLIHMLDTTHWEVKLSKVRNLIIGQMYWEVGDE